MDTRELRGRTVTGTRVLLVKRKRWVRKLSAQHITPLTGTAPPFRAEKLPCTLDKTRHLGQISFLRDRGRSQVKHSGVPHYFRVNPTTTADQLALWFRQWQAHNTKQSINTGFKLLIPTISFITAGTMNRWAGSLRQEDFSARTTMSMFLRESFDMVGLNVLCSLWSFLVGNWVKNASKGAWDRMPWHAFAVAIIRREDDPSKKICIIYDVDVTLDHHPRWYAQRHLIRALPKSYEVWYSKDRSDSAKNKCLQQAFNCLFHWYLQGDKLWSGHLTDPRTRNYERIRLGSS